MVQCFFNNQQQSVALRRIVNIAQRHALTMNKAIFIDATIYAKYANILDSSFYHYYHS